LEARHLLTAAVAVNDSFSTPEDTPLILASTNQTLIEEGSVWKYLDNGTNQGTAWRGLTYNDGAWPAGPAQLGYGDGDEVTEVGYGSDPGNKFPTTYFRHTFDVLDADAVVALSAELIRDDGYVAYLNGTEISREG